MTAGRAFASVGLALAIGGAVGGITLRIVDHVPLVQTSFGFSDTALVGFEFLGVTFAAVGALLVVRVPQNAVGWVMVLIGDGYALSGLTAAMTSSAIADGPAGAGIAGFAGWLTVLFTTIGGLVFVLGFMFPTGRGHTEAWDRLLRLGAVGFPFVMTVLVLIRPGALHVFPTIDNPFGVGPDLSFVVGPQVSSVLAGSSALFVPVVAWNIVSRYRMSDRVGRKQLKWFILSLLVALGAVVVTGFSALVDGQAPEAGLVVFGYAGALVPIAIGIAILRHHLYDIDRIISRTISYGVVSAMLVAVYAGLILVLQGPLGAVTGGDTVAVAASTLVAAALFQPIRRRTQAAVDHRFNRARYDAERTIDALATRLRDEMDLPIVRSAVVDAVARSVEPTAATLWLRPGRFS